MTEQGKEIYQDGNNKNFLNECGDYYSPVLSMDSMETNLIRIFVCNAKIKVKYNLSDFEFEIIK